MAYNILAVFVLRGLILASASHGIKNRCHEPEYVLTLKREALRQQNECWCYTRSIQKSMPLIQRCVPTNPVSWPVLPFLITSRLPQLPCLRGQRASSHGGRECASFSSRKQTQYRNPDTPHTFLFAWRPRSGALPVCWSGES